MKETQQHSASDLIEANPFIRDPGLSDDLKKFLIEKSIESANAPWVRQFEVRKWRWTTPLAVALTGAITIGLNFAFDFWRARQSQDFKQRSDAAEAQRKASNAEREFEFKIVERELSQNKSEAERAQVLLFLVRAGVLNGLNTAELKAMAEATLARGKNEASPIGIPSLGQREIIEGPKQLSEKYLGDFKSFFDSLQLKHLKMDQFLVTGESNANPTSSAFNLNSYPPQELWTNVRLLANVLDKFVDRYGAPIEIISAFRGTRYAASIGSAANSTHMQFRAADFRVPTKGTAKEWAKVMLEIRSEGVFSGGIGVYDGFVHVDTRGTTANWGSSGTETP